MSDVRVQNVDKSYHKNRPDGAVHVLRDLTLAVPAGQFIGLVGPNGSGKTTFLRILAGLESPDTGSVTIAGSQPSRVRIGYVAQNFYPSLLPWIDARQNILFPFSLAANRPQYASAVQDLDRFLALFPERLPLDRYPYQLSSGQQQLTTILRSLVYRAHLLLLDEPFSGLDYSNRRVAYDVVLQYWDEEKPTIVLITHSLDEALLLSDRVLILSERPATIVEDYLVPFTRPRSPALLTSNDFVEARRRLLAANELIAL